jgi:hypothetical protein
MNTLMELHEAHKLRRARLMGIVPAPRIFIPPLPDTNSRPAPTLIPNADAHIRLFERWKDVSAIPPIPADIACHASLALIRSVVASYYKISVNDMLGDCRVSSIVLPRQVGIYLVIELTKASLTKTGLLFKRDHASVLNATRKIKQLIADNDSVAIEIAEIKAILARKYAAGVQHHG